MAHFLPLVLSRAFRLGAVVLLFSGAALPAVAQSTMSASLTGPLPSPLVPSDNWWRLDVSQAPVDPGSDAFIDFIGLTTSLRPNMGRTSSRDPIRTYGMPYAVVRGVQAADLRSVVFRYARESDGVNHADGSHAPYPFYPIPQEAITQAHWIEQGWPGNEDHRDGHDRHLLIYDADNHWLYELFDVFHDVYEGQWYAGSGAFFDLSRNTRRPEGWTSADAAGLAILPGLLRWDEVYGPGEIAHALRVTMRTTNGYVYPASHRAGATPGALPLGARLRLRADYDISAFPEDMQKVFRAFKRYGLIVADNGPDMAVGGTSDERWNGSVLRDAFSQLTAYDFDVVELGWQAPPAVDVGGSADPATTR